MALASTMVWETRATGDAANSGGFNSAAAGTDRSQQDAPHVIVDGVTITATVHVVTLTSLILSGYTVTAADVGNTFRVAGGTATAGTYEITSVDVGGNRWICDRNVGTAGQTAEGRMGGAGSDMALLTVVSVAFNKVWVRAGAYTITSATQNVAGGCPLMTNGGQVWEGYETVRGDLGTPPVFTASGIVTATLLAVSGNDVLAVNLTVDGALLTAIRGIVMTGRGTIYRCTALNCTNSGLVVSAFGMAIGCRAAGCTTAGAGILDNAGGQALYLSDCIATGNTVVGFSLNAAVAVRCISAGNTGATTDGFLVGSSGDTVINCTAYGNGRDGFRGTAAPSSRVINCLSEANVGIGFNFSGPLLPQLYFCGVFGNGTPTAGTFGQNVGFVTGTGSFFTNAAGGDFSLNNTVGAGAAVRRNGLPGTFLGSITTAYLDRGAVQTSGSESGGGGSGAGGPVLGQVWGGGA